MTATLCHAGFKIDSDPCPECGAAVNETCGKAHLVLEAEVTQLRAENKWLREANKGLNDELKEARAENMALEVKYNIARVQRDRLKQKLPPEATV